MLRRVVVVFGIGVAAIVFGVALLAGSDTSGAGAAACGTAAAGPEKVAGVPTGDLQYFEGAAEFFSLGSKGWMYLAGLNFDESGFDTSQLPGVHMGANATGAAGPMQIGVGGQATDNWDTVVGEIPTGLVGGAQPAPSVYNEADAVYAGAALLARWGAPADWLAALEKWNDDPDEIATVQAWVAKLTKEVGGAAGGAPASTGGAPSTPPVTVASSTTPGAAGESSSTASSPVPLPGSGSGTCVSAAGPAVPGSGASVTAQGLATIPESAPVEVQEMLAAGNQIIDYPYSWGGAHGNVAAMTIPPGPAVDPGEQENGGPGFDCSSAVSFLMWNAGLGMSLMHDSVFTSYQFETAGQAGTGNWVTIYAGTSGGVGHVFVEVDGVVMDTVHDGVTVPAGTGPRWQTIADLRYELASGRFVARHPAGL